MLLSIGLAGVGIQIFFHSTAAYGKLFVALSLLSLYAMYTDHKANSLGDEGTSISNESLGEVSSSSVIALQAFFELMISLTVLLFITILHAKNRALGQIWDRLNLTAEDYALMISGLPPETTYLQVMAYTKSILETAEFGARFQLQHSRSLVDAAQFGDPTELVDGLCICLTDVDDLVTTWRERNKYRIITEQIQRVLVQGRQHSSLANQKEADERFDRAQKVLGTYKEKLEELENKYKEAEKDSLDRPCTGFAIMTLTNTMTAETLARWFKADRWYNKLQLIGADDRVSCEPPKFKLGTQEYPVTINRAPIPSSIHYENFFISATERRCRLFQTLSVTLTLTLRPLLLLILALTQTFHH